MPEINFFNDDCLEAMKKMPDNKYKLAIVDPPYGYGDEKTQILNFRQKEQHGNWNIAPSQEYFDELFRVSENQIIWGGNYFSYIWNFGGRCFIYWHKGNPVENFADGELAWTSFDRNAKQFDYRYYGNLEGNTSTSKKFHPTQKPISLYEWILMNFAKETDNILDTHGGSHSIALACHNLDFNLDVYEIDEKYHESGKKRYKDHVSQIRLF